MSSSDYPVGYARPPRHRQFKPGQSGNPKGRPKKQKSLAALLKEIMFRPVTIKENGTRRKVPFVEAFLSGLVHLAVNGDPRARRDLLKLFERHPGVVKHQQPLRVIEDGMTPREAAKIYAATLKAIPGLTYPEHETFGPEDEV